MNTKFFFALLAVLIVFVAAALVPAIAGGSASTATHEQEVSAGAQAANSTGENTAAGTGNQSEPRLWSGEVFLSDSDSPDHALKLETSSQPETPGGCMSASSLPRRYGGCAE